MVAHCVEILGVRVATPNYDSTKVCFAYPTACHDRLQPVKTVVDPVA